MKPAEIKLNEPQLSSPNEFLRKIYLERRARNQSYSSRAFARDLGMSQAYMSLILNDRKPVTIRQAARISALLNLSVEQTEALLNSVMDLAGPKSKLIKRIKFRHSQVEESSQAKSSLYIDLQVERFTAISRWYHVAILDLTLTRGFKSAPAWIGKRLGITAFEAKDAVDRLVRLGFLELRDGEVRKTESKIYFQTQKSEAAVRTFHREMIGKALTELATTDEIAFEAREISSVTIPVDPEKIAIARKRIQEFQRSMADLLSNGERHEVYQLNVQLFPLTKRESEKV